MGHLEIIRRIGGLHLGQIGLPLLSNLHHHAGLLQQQLTLGPFFRSNLDASRIIEHLQVTLHDVASRLVLLCSQLALPHQQARLGSPQIVILLQTVEDRDAGRKAIPIIEGADIRIGIGLRVDGTSEIILATDRSFDARKKGSDRPGLFRPIVIHGNMLHPHIPVVRHGILDALVNGPGLLCRTVYAG